MVMIDGIKTTDYKICEYDRPDIPTPEQEIKQIHIRGRERSLTKKYGFKDIEHYPITFNYLENVSFKKVFRGFKAALFNSKKLSFSDDPNIYYKIKSIVIENAETKDVEHGIFTVYFTLDPFQYEIENDPITITKETTIENDGHTAQPTITAQVAGTGNIYIGEQEITIKDVNGTITIDSEMQNAYRKTSTITENMNSHMIGKFPVLEHGKNVINFDGDVESLEVVANRRWV